MPRDVGGECTAAVTAALAPYAWRELTDRMLVRRALAAVDRHDVLRFLSCIAGTDAGEAAPVEAAADDDVRVDALVLALDGHVWRGWSVARLSAELVTALDAWHAEREALDLHLRRLLGGQ